MTCFNFLAFALGNWSMVPGDSAKRPALGILVDRSSPARWKACQGRGNLAFVVAPDSTRLVGLWWSETGFCIRQKKPWPFANQVHVTLVSSQPSTPWVLLPWALWVLGQGWALQPTYLRWCRSKCPSRCHSRCHSRCPSRCHSRYRSRSRNRCHRRWEGLKEELLCLSFLGGSFIWVNCSNEMWCQCHP